MTQNEITRHCECCGTERIIHKLHVVCPDCLHDIRNEKMKEDCRNMDWGEDENEQT